ncbi:rRNA-processing protein fyv7 [Schizosaccharomyces pombe]|uniref:rRNA-processing protein fyv7 n=1 Tax=Schizosaccharomyces pombe (strain 972 / ATCC 24843) TaxID=284812 RepID=FYV7_SCHPO|nr:putative rRNA processing protein Fyv7 [Schizosaccharomyces pombe]O14276.1 RecName: Full=rRNA-processing protein fyv7 [Schizosaccharomyces pombe 972h-]CAB16295.1 rRNA processing protein Fyv7 (predicted) [Schizosaccharomyces pombe]|eukprot:NP_594278.1 putative rRNA processing protein Fyv7 [Schizosaccharomyces pombe]
MANHSSSSSDQGTKKKGFKFRQLPEHAYQGKAKRIKQDLILKAKTKKHFYKNVRPEEYIKKGSGERKRKFSKKSHLQELYERSEEKRRIQQEKEDAKVQKRLEIEKKQKDREQTRNMLSKKTKRGQPIMRNQINHLLAKVKQTS